ncbi:amino acid/amide ABC transporter substrate-binding protein (HAAT family) [Aestuariispira insulae]|uniref:Amino acid/amide ABC transporter substrate-binding protein (HAAT family) n=1 Tax=Aestuariispira insulae TaxID=1461337 RepID=A0A3D9HPQ1_9PROT|nr:amino acid/amide ABC transporter substrate-binding protein (HAAT family) [Aestuariispira insulae]
MVSRRLAVTGLCLAMTACVIPELQSPKVNLPPDEDQGQLDASAPPFSPAADGKQAKGTTVDSGAPVQGESLEDPDGSDGRTATYDSLDGTGTRTFQLTPPEDIDLPTIKVALLLPLGSNDSGLRQDAAALRDAAEMALFDWRDERVSLMPLDTKGTFDGAESASVRAVEQGADIILGPLLRTSVGAVSPIAQRADIPVLSFSNDPSVGGNDVYSLGLSPFYEVDRLMAYAVSKGLTRIALLAPDDIYGNLIVQAAQQSLSRYGGEITHLSFYNPAATDFSEQVRYISNYDSRRAALKSRVRELEQRQDEVSKAALRQLSRKETLGNVAFEAILIPTLDELTLRTLAAQLAQYEVDQPAVRFLGLSVWDEFRNLSSEPPLQGAWYIAPPDSGWRQFATRFRDNYGRLPPSIAALSYEAMALTILLAGKEEVVRYQGKLTNPKGFQGVRGIFRLNRNGESERGLAIKQITRKGIEIMEPAPGKFENYLN